MKPYYTLADLRQWEKVEEELGSTARLAVIGNPVEHSRSPGMHQAALDALGIKTRYVRLLIQEEEFAEALELIVAKQFIGANVTIPHKQAALEGATYVSEHARKMRAVNTLVVRDNKELEGFSTDGPGFVRAIREEFGMDLRDLRVLMLGAGGGAGRSLSVQCALEDVPRLVLSNRTFEKAEVLREELKELFVSDRLIGPEDRLVVVPMGSAAMERELRAVDLIVNATSVGMRRSDPEVLPGKWIDPSHCIFDTVYSGGKTKLLAAAEANGARGVNGLAMLLHQGALSFEYWFDQDAPIEEMRKGLAG